MANLYEFSGSLGTYRYTSSINNITYSSNLYTAIPISRSELVFQMAEQHVKIQMPKTSEPATTLIDENINNRLTLSIMNISGDVLFKGNLVSCAVGVDKDRIILKFSPDFLTNNSEIPTRTYSRNCNYSLYEGYNGSSEATSPRCPKNRKDASLNPLINETRTGWTFTNKNKTLARTATDSDLNIGSTDYVQGQVVLENGGAVYSSSIIVSHSVVDNGGGNYTATINLLYPLHLKDNSDVLFIYKGCDKKIATCSSKFNIDDHFGGFPEMPKAHLMVNGKTNTSGYQTPSIGYKNDGSVALNDAEMDYEYDGVIPLIFGETWITPQTIWLGPSYREAIELATFLGIKDISDGRDLNWDGFIDGDERQEGFKGQWEKNGVGQHYFQSFIQVLCEIITGVKGYKINGIPVVTANELAGATRGSTNAASFPLTNTNSYFAIPLDLGNEDRFKYAFSKQAVDQVIKTSVSSVLQEPDIQTIEEVFSPSYASVHFGEQTSIDAFVDNLTEGTHIQKKRWIKGVAYVAYRHNKRYGDATGVNDDLSGFSALGSDYGNTNYWLSRMGAYIGRDVENIPKIEYYVDHYPDLPSPYNDATKKKINDAANPVCIIYWILSNILDVPDSDIDLAGFDTARDLLHTENLGINIAVTKKTKTIDFLNKILAVIDGALVWKSVLGFYKWSIALARSSDSVSKTITISNANNLSFERMGWDKAYSGIEVTYRPPDKKDDQKITHNNEAAREMIGINKIKKIDMAGISTENTLKAVLSREFSRWTRPLTSLSFDYYDSENELYPHDLITLDLTDTGITYDINENFRVVSVSGLNEASNKRRVKCIQDYVISYTDEVFMPAAAPYGITEPTLDVGDITVASINQGWQELSYPNLSITPLASKPTGDIIDIRAFNVVKNNSGNPSSVSCLEWYKGLITADLDAGYSFIDVSSTGLTFKLDENIYLPNFTGRDDQFFAMPRLAICNSTIGEQEVISYNKLEYVSTSGGYKNYRLTGIVRNVLGHTRNTDANTLVNGQFNLLSNDDIWIGFGAAPPTLPIAPVLQTGRTPTTGYSNSPSSTAEATTEKVLVDFYAFNNSLMSDKFAVDTDASYESVTPYPINQLEQFATAVVNDNITTIYIRYFPTRPKSGPWFGAPNSSPPKLGSLNGISWELTFKEGTNQKMGNMLVNLKKGFTFPNTPSGDIFTPAECSIRQVLDELVLTNYASPPAYIRPIEHPYYGAIELTLTGDFRYIDIESTETLTVEIKSVNDLGYKSEARSIDIVLP